VELLQLLYERAARERENHEVGLQVEIILGARFVAGELRPRGVGRATWSTRRRRQLGFLPPFRKASVWRSPTGKGSGLAETGYAPSRPPLFTETGKAGLVAAGLSTAALRAGEAELTPHVTNREQTITKTIVARGLRMALLLEVEGCAGARGYPATSSLPRRAWSPPTGQATWLALRQRRGDDSCGTAPVSHRTSLTSRLLSGL
jgi:hypothetical protein